MKKLFYKYIDNTAKSNSVTDALIILATLLFCGAYSFEDKLLLAIQGFNPNLYRLFMAMILVGFFAVTIYIAFTNGVHLKLNFILILTIVFALGNLFIHYNGLLFDIKYAKTIIFVCNWLFVWSFDFFTPLFNVDLLNNGYLFQLIYLTILVTCYIIGVLLNNIINQYRETSL